MESTDATDHLSVDFERVVSYDNAVSDDSRAEDIYATEETAANLPEASASATPSDTASATGSATATPSATPSTSASSTSSASASTSAGPSQTPADLQPRKLSGLGDEAFLDDKLNSGSSTAQQRTVTVVFRTSNVIVRIEYAEQPTASTGTPDSEEMQDKARNLARKLVDRFND